jgi:YgiT-type zinc finger domain-containing protein
MENIERTNTPCFEDGCNGVLIEVIKDYIAETQKGTVVVPDVPTSQCNVCGEECFSSKACRMIDKALYGDE